MGAVEFGQLVTRRMGELGFSQNKVARRFGELPDGRGLDSTQVRMIKEGRRVLDHALVGRLIVVLELDADPDLEAEAWHAAGLQPPGATLADYRDIIRRRGAARDRRSDREFEASTTPAGVVVRAETGQTGD